MDPELVVARSAAVIRGRGMERRLANDFHRRRRLRLGALLYQLRYFAVLDSRDDQGEPVLFRHDARRSVEVTGSLVRLVAGDSSETLDLEAAIVRCKDALRGLPLHGPPAASP
ncbi:MAG TPA: hypothetical protein VNL71_17615 [Chloroflexota bacterium]|nr:hypothetical protein [Chloroflexota bacterium]